MKDEIDSQNNREPPHAKLSRKVASKEARKLRARREKDGAIWYGLGMMGVIGWSVTIPTLLGIALGIWIDFRWPSRYSWSLMLLFIGIVLGCLNAWYWVERERKRR
jgi:ATP synthase protein I